MRCKTKGKGDDMIRFQRAETHPNISLPNYKLIKTPHNTLVAMSFTYKLSWYPNTIFDLYYWGVNKRGKLMA